MDYSNAAYYTFSTISQTLAGAFAFLTAAALYRMQIIQIITLPNIHKQSETIQPEIEQSLESGDGTPEPLLDKMKARDQAILYAQDKYNVVRVGLRTSLRWTAGTIIGCLILMPLVPMLACFPWWRLFLILVAVVAVASYTIKTYYDLVIEVTRP